MFRHDPALNEVRAEAGQRPRPGNPLDSSIDFNSMGPDRPANGGQLNALSRRTDDRQKHVTKSRATIPGGSLLSGSNGCAPYIVS